MAETTTVTTIIPAWNDPFKKQFIIYNRDENTDIRKSPDITNIESGDRTAFVFDTINKNLVLHTVGTSNTDDASHILIGHTELNSGGKHNEVFNDYNGNSTSGVVSYAFVCGYNNIVKYNNSNGGGFTSGHYNKSDVSYIMTIGNGTDDTNRSNIISVTDSSVIIGYSPEETTGKYISIKNGNVVIGGNLTVNGEINGKSGSGGNYDTAIEELKSTVESLQKSLTAVTTSLADLTVSYNNLYNTVSNMNETLNNMPTVLTVE